MTRAHPTGISHSWILQRGLVYNSFNHGANKADFNYIDWNNSMVDLSANVNCPVACLIIGFVALSVCLKSEIMAEELSNPNCAGQHSGYKDRKRNSSFLSFPNRG